MNTSNIESRNYCRSRQEKWQEDEDKVGTWTKHKRSNSNRNERRRPQYLSTSAHRDCPQDHRLGNSSCNKPRRRRPRHQPRGQQVSWCPSVSDTSSCSTHSGSTITSYEYLSSHNSSSRSSYSESCMNPCMKNEIVSWDDLGDTLKTACQNSLQDFSLSEQQEFRRDYNASLNNKEEHATRDDVVDDDLSWDDLEDVIEQGLKQSLTDLTFRVIEHQEWRG